MNFILEYEDDEYYDDEYEDYDNKDDANADDERSGKLDTDTEVESNVEDGEAIETEGKDDELVDQDEEVGDDEYLDDQDSANAGNGENDDDEEYADEEYADEVPVDEKEDVEDAVNVIEDAVDVIADSGTKDVDDLTTEDIPEGSGDIITGPLITDEEVPEGSGDDDLDQETGTDHPLGEGAHVPEGSGQSDNDEGSGDAADDQGSGNDPEYESVTQLPDEDPENNDDETRIVGVGGQEDDLPEEGSGFGEPSSPEDDTTAVSNDKVGNDDTTSSPDDDYPDPEIVITDDTTLPAVLEDDIDEEGSGDTEVPDLQDEGNDDVSAEIEDITTAQSDINENDLEDKIANEFDDTTDDEYDDTRDDDNDDTTSDPNADEEYESGGGGFLSGYEDKMSQGRTRPSSHEDPRMAPGLWKEKPDHPGLDIQPECRSDIKKVMGRISRKIKEKHNHMMTATRIIVQVMKDTLDEL